MGQSAVSTHLRGDRATKERVIYNLTKKEMAGEMIRIANQNNKNNFEVVHPHPEENTANIHFFFYFFSFLFLLIYLTEENTDAATRNTYLHFELDKCCLFLNINLFLSYIIG